MKRKTNIFKIVSIFTAFALGITSLITVLTKTPKEIEAEQHLNNYSLYSYTGTYYSDKNIALDGTGGMDGTIRTSLSSKNRPADYYTYGGYSVGNNLSTVLQKADEDPDNPSNMIYFYTRNSVTKTAANADANTIIWNREHVWCQSLSNDNWGKTEAGTDILHLRPTYAYTNNSRGDKPYGDNNHAGELKYNDMTYGYADKLPNFEPIDSVKGDVARIIMYVWVTYTGYPGYNDISIGDIIESYDTLIKWHTMDKPDVLEGNRNDYCEEQSIQGNRNPFVDHPELAWKIFGAEVENQTILNDCVTAYPAEGYVPVNPTSIELNETSLSLDINETFALSATLQPTGAVGTVSWSSSQTAVATVDGNGVVTARGAGSAVIKAKVTDSIYATCSVTVQPSGGTTTDNIFEADLTVEKTVNNGFAISSANVSKKTGFYQDGGTANSSVNYFMVKGNSPLFDNQPSQIALTVTLGAGSNKNPLDNNVEACFVDSNGNELSSSKVTVASKLQKDPQDIVVNLPYTANAYGVKLMHVKEDSWNVRYYGFSLSATYSTSTGPEAYLGAATAIKTIRGDATVNVANKTNTIIFKELGLNNGTQYLDPFDGTYFTVKFAGGGNDGKYYDTGTGIRTYDNGTITITSKTGKDITQITMTWSGSSYKPTAASVVNTGSYNTSTGVWTGSASSVTFTRPDSGGGHWRLQKVEATCLSNSVTINSLDVRFGIKIAIAAWDAITTNGWEIQDYGVMMFLTTEARLSSAPTVKSRYELDPDFEEPDYVAIGHRESGLTPAIDGQGNYNFMVKVSIPNALPTPEGFNYNSYFCVRPFVKIDNQIYWLLEDDIQESVRSLAGGTNTGTNLDKDVLDYLAA